MNYGTDSTLPSAGVTAWPQPMLCARCPQARMPRPNRGGLCDDCWDAMSPEDRKAWRGR